MRMTPTQRESRVPREERSVENEGVNQTRPLHGGEARCVPKPVTIGTGRSGPRGETGPPQDGPQTGSPNPQVPRCTPDRTLVHPGADWEGHRQVPTPSRVLTPPDVQLLSRTSTHRSRLRGTPPGGRGVTGPLTRGGAPGVRVPRPTHRVGPAQPGPGLPRSRPGRRPSRRLLTVHSRWSDTPAGDEPSLVAPEVAPKRPEGGTSRGRSKVPQGYWVPEGAWVGRGGGPRSTCLWTGGGRFSGHPRDRLDTRGYREGMRLQARSMDWDLLSDTHGPRG